MAVEDQSVKCGRCRAKFQIPASLDQSIKAEVAHLFRKEGPLQAIRLLHQHTDLGLARCKALIKHFQTLPGSCHRCGRELSVEAFGNCPHCGSLNIDWEAA